MNATAAAFEDAFRGASGEADVYNRFDPLARRAGITIKRLEPSHRDAAFSDGPAEVATSGFMVECEGTLEAAGAFMRLVQRDNGLSRIAALRISPIAGPAGVVELVHMSLKTEHVTISGLFDDVGTDR
jgi:hypothetical protein